MEATVQLGDLLTVYHEGYGNVTLTSPVDPDGDGL